MSDDNDCSTVLAWLNQNQDYYSKYLSLFDFEGMVAPDRSAQPKDRKDIRGNLILYLLTTFLNKQLGEDTKWKTADMTNSNFMETLMKDRKNFKSADAEHIYDCTRSGNFDNEERNKFICTLEDGTFYVRLEEFENEMNGISRYILYYLSQLRNKWIEGFSNDERPGDKELTRAAYEAIGNEYPNKFMERHLVKNKDNDDHGHALVWYILSVKYSKIIDSSGNDIYDFNENDIEPDNIRKNNGKRFDKKLPANFTLKRRDTTDTKRYAFFGTRSKGLFQEYINNVDDFFHKPGYDNINKCGHRSIDAADDKAGRAIHRLKGFTYFPYTNMVELLLKLSERLYRTPKTSTASFDLDSLYGETVNVRLPKKDEGYWRDDQRILRKGTDGLAYAEPTAANSREKNDTVIKKIAKCETVPVSSTYCKDILINCFYGEDVTKCRDAMKSNDWWKKMEEEKLEPMDAYVFLTRFGFSVKEKTATFENGEIRDIKVVESVSSWLGNLTEVSKDVKNLGYTMTDSDVKELKNNHNLIEYLNYAVDKVNKNVCILNTDCMPTDRARADNRSELSKWGLKPSIKSRNEYSGMLPSLLRLRDGMEAYYRGNIGLLSTFPAHPLLVGTQRGGNEIQLGGTWHSPTSSPHVHGKQLHSMFNATLSGLKHHGKTLDAASLNAFKEQIQNYDEAVMKIGKMAKILGDYLDLIDSGLPVYKSEETWKTLQDITDKHKSRFSSVHRRGNNLVAFLETMLTALNDEETSQGNLLRNVDITKER